MTAAEWASLAVGIAAVLVAIAVVPGVRSAGLAKVLVAMAVAMVVIALVLATVAAGWLRGGKSAGPSPSTAGPSTISSPKTTRSPGTTSPETTRSLELAVRWGPGEIVMSGSENTDLDSTPPTARLVTGVDVDLYWYLTGDGPHFSGFDNLALYTGGGSPDPTSCLDLVLRESATDIRVGKGSIVCVKTGRERVAALRVVSVDETAQRMRASVIVWG